MNNYTVCIVGAMIISSVSSAQVPQRLNLHGRLQQNGNPVNGSVEFTIRLYDGQSVNQTRWTEVIHDACTDGFYSITLGASEPLNPEILNETHQLYLGISLNGHTELRPRIALSSVPYAMLSSMSQNAQDLSCIDCVSAPEVSFSYASSNSSGGPATDLDCDDACVSTKELGDSSITSSKLAENSITADKVPDQALPLSKLAHCSEGDVLRMGADGWECSSTLEKRGSTFIHWGNGSAPDGGSLLYSGWAFNSRYNDNGGGRAVCIKSGDPGPVGPGGNHADLVWPVNTGDATRMPPGIAAYTRVACANVYVEGPVTEVWGSQTCPDNWSTLYAGYGMGGYYAHVSPTDRVCVNAHDFDDSIARTVDQSWWAGTTLYANSDLPQYETNRWVQCVVCTQK